MVTIRIEHEHRIAARQRLSLRLNPLLCAGGSWFSTRGRALLGLQVGQPLCTGQAQQVWKNASLPGFGRLGSPELGRRNRLARQQDASTNGEERFTMLEYEQFVAGRRSIAAEIEVTRNSLAGSDLSLVRGFLNSNPCDWSTMRRLSGKRKSSHTAWLMTSAGKW